MKNLNNNFSSEDVSYIIKQLTKSKDFNRSAFFEISRTGGKIDLLDIINSLRQNKLNFITTIIQRISTRFGHPMPSFIVEVLNQSEISDFKNLIYRKNGILKIRDSSCIVNQIEDSFKCALVSTPADINIQDSDLLPTCVKYNLGPRYHRFIPSVLLVEILQELKIKQVLNHINGISIRYLSTQRIIDNNIILRVLHEVFDSTIKENLRDLGNTNMETLLEYQILAHNDIWSHVGRTSSADNTQCYVLNHNLILNDVLTNGREINSLLNRLGPRID